MLRMIVQMRIKIATYAAVFLFAAAALPASADSLTPVSYAVDVQGSSTQTSYYDNLNNKTNWSTTQTFTGVMTYPYAPSLYSASAYLGYVQNSAANVNAHVSYRPVDPTIMANASAGSLQPGIISSPSPNYDNLTAAELWANVSGSVSYQYAFEVASQNVVPVTVTVDMEGVLTVNTSNNSSGNYSTSTASITLADQLGTALGALSFTSTNGNGTTFLPFNKKLDLLTNTEYFVTLYASALAYSYSSTGNGLTGGATALAAIDPSITCDPATPICTTVTYSADLTTPLTTPLPSTWVMLLSGFAGLGFFAYRGSKKRAALAAA